MVHVAHAQHIPSEEPLSPHPDYWQQELQTGYHLVFVPSFSNVAVLNSATQALFERLYSAQPLHTLADNEQTIAHHLATLGLLTAPQLPLPSSSPSDELVAWLHVTNACNLRCTYCYLPRTNTRMSPETGFAAVQAVLRSAQHYGYKRVVLKYAGGEPLLNLPLVAQLHQYARHQAQQIGLVLEGILLSNGSLLDAQCVQQIAELGLRLAISLDGSATFHNQQRPTAQGNGSWESVWQGIQYAQAGGLGITISVTVSGATIDGLPELVALLRQHDLPFTLNFYRENTQSQSNPSLQLDIQHLIDGMRATYRVIEQNLPDYSLLGSLLDRVHPGGAHHRPCGVGENYLVIDQQGRVAKCHMQMEQTVATVWDDDPLSAVRHDETGIQNPTVEQKAGCQTCPWRFWCAGGCSFATHHATGRYDNASPLCQVYQALCPDVLRLEGLRLLSGASKLQLLLHTSESRCICPTQPTT
jgi:uncharacterized protein